MSFRTAVHRPRVLLRESYREGSKVRKRIEHPASHSDNDAWLYFDVDDLTGSPALAVLPAHPATE